MTESLFPSIGKIADETDKIVVADDEEPTATTSNDDRDPDAPLDTIPSLCMKCHSDGTTRLLLTSIPYFRELILMSFACPNPDCGWTNNEIQSAAEILESGTKWVVRIQGGEGQAAEEEERQTDLNRQIVRSAFCYVEIPELELTLPPTGKGTVTTVEGLLRDVSADLEVMQPVRRVQAPEAYEKIEGIVRRISGILGERQEGGEEVGDGEGRRAVFASSSQGGEPFTIKLDDPSGNSFLEFVGSVTSDKKWEMKTYKRTLEQNVELGLISEEEAQAEKEKEEKVNGEITDDEIFVFKGVCSSCGHPIDNLMKKVNIPHFKDIIIMSTNCTHCGYRDNEVKSGSSISPRGKKITLRVVDKEDLSRDVLKSETAGLSIPSLDLTLTHGTLGGRFTTLEGLLEQIYTELKDRVVLGGDSASSSIIPSTLPSISESEDPPSSDAAPNDATKFTTFLKSLHALLSVPEPFTIVLDDPLANSYIQNLYAPDEDPEIQVEEYVRTWEMDEELGLNDIDVGEGKEEDGSEKKKEAAEAAPQ